MLVFIWLLYFITHSLLRPPSPKKWLISFYSLFLQLSSKSYVFSLQRLFVPTLISSVSTGLQLHFIFTLIFHMPPTLSNVCKSLILKTNTCFATIPLLAIILFIFLVLTFFFFFQKIKCAKHPASFFLMPCSLASSLTPLLPNPKTSCHSFAAVSPFFLKLSLFA